MSDKISKYAGLEVSVTTCFGAMPVAGAEVTVNYKGTPDGEGELISTRVTDENGKCEPFLMSVRRERIRDRYIDFPRNTGCDVSVCADGYIVSSAKDVPIFSDITVRRVFDLIPKRADS